MLIDCEPKNSRDLFEGYRRAAENAVTAILSDRAGIDPAQIAQIGRERLEGIRVGVGAP